MKLLDNKKALVLGGSRGVGAAIVERLISEGAEVVFTYNGSEAAAKKLSDKTGAKHIKVDSAERSAVTSAIANQKQLDILVVNAGILILGDALEINPDDVDRMIDINTRSPYHASVEAARIMPDGGRIVIIGSVNGDRMPFAGGAAYGMTKSAVQGIVRGLARDFGPRGITINNIQPGPVDTDMNPADGPMHETMHSFMAIQRHAKPQEIAGMVNYLVGPEAAMVTGTQLTIDGGFGA